MVVLWSGRDWQGAARGASEACQEVLLLLSHRPVAASAETIPPWRSLLVSWASREALPFPFPVLLRQLPKVQDDSQFSRFAVALQGGLRAPVPVPVFVTVPLLVPMLLWLVVAVSILR